MSKYILKCETDSDLKPSERNANSLQEAKIIKRNHETSNSDHRVRYYPVLRSNPIKNKINQIRHFVGLEVIDWKS
jgi:hypothetical protein